MEPLKAVVELSFRLMLRNKKTLVMAILCLAPPALALLGVAVARVRDNASGFTGFGLASELFVSAYVHGYLIFLPLFYATSFIREEVDDKTITYLFIRPIPRKTIYLGKFLAGALACVALVMPSAALTFAILGTLDPPSETLRHAGVVVQDLAILALGTLAYCALFGAFGTLLKRPLLWGIVFAAIWEIFVTHLPGYIHNFTILHYLLSLLPHPSAQRGLLRLFEALTASAQTAPVPLAILTLLVVPSALVALGAWVVSRREYLLEA
jgi:ABC-2 type transport system permease protein